MCTHVLPYIIHATSYRPSRLEERNSSGTRRALANLRSASRPRSIADLQRCTPRDRSIRHRVRYRNRARVTDNHGRRTSEYLSQKRVGRKYFLGSGSRARFENYIGSRSYDFRKRFRSFPRRIARSSEFSPSRRSIMIFFTDFSRYSGLRFDGPERKSFGVLLEKAFIFLPVVLVLINYSQQQGVGAMTRLRRSGVDVN